MSGNSGIIKEYQVGNRTEELNRRRLHIMTNKTILTLIERASRKGVAKAYSYRGEYGEKQHVEKYRVTVESSGSGQGAPYTGLDKWLLYHYDTLTATVTNGVGAVVYGESRSDVDSIQTFISELTGYTPELHYYPSKDLFIMAHNDNVLDQL